jgi:transcriptional regulator GlxA family with amidase domain
MRARFKPPDIELRSQHGSPSRHSGSDPDAVPGHHARDVYWLPASSVGDHIVDLTMAKPHDGRVLQALQHLRRKFSDPIRVEQLASAAGMSPATFHRQFTLVTSMSPMQIPEQLRLVEARRLMITSDFNVEALRLRLDM